MEHKGEFQSVYFDTDGGTIATFKFQNRKKLLEDYQNFKDKILSLVVKKHRDTRSVEANAYCWLLMGKIAKIIKSSSDEVYHNMLTAYGTLEEMQYSVRDDKDNLDYDAFKDNWMYIHSKPIGESYASDKSGAVHKFNHYQLIKGSSRYNTKEMFQLIDGVIYEAEKLGISTITPREKEAMKQRFGDAYDKKMQKGRENESDGHNAASQDGSLGA